MQQLLDDGNPGRHRKMGQSLTAVVSEMRGGQHLGNADTAAKTRKKKVLLA
jgi:hypothetical protein